MSTQVMGGRAHRQFFINQTDLLAPTAQNIVAPSKGFLRKVAVIIQVAVTTGGTLTFKNAAGTTITGLTLTIPNGATVGTKFTATATGDGTEAVSTDDRIQIVPASFATAGALNGYIEVNDSLAG